eukprot:TRINITY_DN107459_c0_g1_i1.p1 TRINITY_DN107459_c0_g1~~TRINITY_DN107459_c0_g1_i1.p1  ORF type:complete len:740 (+),score=74.93 TRINITY_DN107459_c0_g1_i1:47-2266(+)
MLRFLVIAALLSCVLCQRGGWGGRGDESTSRREPDTPTPDPEAFERLAEFLSSFPEPADDVVALRNALRSSPADFYAVATLFVQHHMGVGRLGVHLRELCDMLARILEQNGINFHFYECLLDEVCADDNVCTEDSCAHQMCINEPIKGCIPCQTEEQCNDGNSCTTDACYMGRCANTALPGCASCHFDYDCKDDSTCTDDWCNNGQCEHVRVANCVEKPTDCPNLFGMSVFCPIDSICRESCADCVTATDAYPYRVDTICTRHCWGVGMYSCEDEADMRCVSDCASECGADYTVDHDRQSCRPAGANACKKNGQKYCETSNTCMDDCEYCKGFPQTTEDASCQKPCYGMEEGDYYYCPEGTACQYDYYHYLTCKPYPCLHKHEGESCTDVRYYGAPEKVTKCHAQEGSKLMTCEPGCGRYYCESCGRYVDDCCWDCDGSVKDEDSCTCKKGSDIWMDLLSQPQHSTFTSLAQLVYGSVKNLPRCDITIFAPTNEAFERMPEATGILNRAELRENLVKLHIVDDSLKYGQMSGLESAETLLEEPKQQNLGFVRKDGMVCVTGPYFNLGLNPNWDQVLPENLQSLPPTPGRYNLAYIVGDEGWEAGNGIAYSISSVLLPALCKEVEAVQTSIWGGKKPPMAYCEPLVPANDDVQCPTSGWYAGPDKSTWAKEEFIACSQRCTPKPLPNEDQDDSLGFGPGADMMLPIAISQGAREGCDRCIAVCQPTDTFTTPTTSPISGF